MATSTGKIRDNEEGKNPTTVNSVGAPGAGMGYGGEEKTDRPEFSTTRSEGWTGTEEKYSAKNPSTVRSVSGRATGGSAAEDMFHAGQETAQEALGNLTEKARDISSNFASKARDVASGITDRASGAGDYVTQAVKTNPIQSLLIGFGLGCLVGVIVTGTIRR